MVAAVESISSGAITVTQEFVEATEWSSSLDRDHPITSVHKETSPAPIYSKAIFEISSVRSFLKATSRVSVSFINQKDFIIPAIFP